MGAGPASLPPNQTQAGQQSTQHSTSFRVKYRIHKGALPVHHWTLLLNSDLQIACTPSLMSLYGDLPQAKDEDAASKGWASSSSIKKLQPSFRPKQAGSSTLLGVPASLRGGGAGGRTGGRSGSSDGGRGGGRGPPPVVHVSAASGASSMGPGPVMASAAAAQHSSFSFLKAVNGEPLRDEYDPSKPNDFEDIMREREKRKKAAEEEAERAARLREAEQVGASRAVVAAVGLAALLLS